MQIDRTTLPSYVYTIFTLDNKNQISKEDSSWTLRDEARTRRRELVSQGQRVKLYRSVVVVNMPLQYS